MTHTEQQEQEARERRRAFLLARYYAAYPEWKQFHREAMDEAKRLTVNNNTKPKGHK